MVLANSSEYIVQFKMWSKWAVAVDFLDSFVLVYSVRKDKMRCNFEEKSMPKENTRRSKMCERKNKKIIVKICLYQPIINSLNEKKSWRLQFFVVVSRNSVFNHLIVCLLSCQADSVTVESIKTQWTAECHSIEFNNFGTINGILWKIRRQCLVFIWIKPTLARLLWRQTVETKPIDGLNYPGNWAGISEKFESWMNSVGRLLPNWPE